MFSGPEFGDPVRIVARGVVRVEKKITKEDDKKAIASGHEMVLDLKTNELIIRGGQPWILSDSARGRIMSDDGYIRLNTKTGDASFVGPSKGFINNANKQQ